MSREGQGEPVDRSSQEGSRKFSLSPTDKQQIAIMADVLRDMAETLPLARGHKSILRNAARLTEALTGIVNEIDPKVLELDLDACDERDDCDAPRV